MSLQAVEAALAKALPADIAFAVSDPQAEATGLFPEEAAHIARAIDKRQREFAAGRRAARAALAVLGQGASALPVLPSRAPVWPEGFTGSISHCKDACFALCAETRAARSIGCDIELRQPLEAGVVETVTTEEERRWLSAQSAFAPVHLFSAKEAVYKALFPLSGQMLGFQELQVFPDHGGDLFARLACDVQGFATGWQTPVVSRTLPHHVIHMVMVF